MRIFLHVAVGSLAVFFAGAVPVGAPVTIVSGHGGSSPPGQQEAPPGFRIERDNWETPVEPGRSIEIENLHGDVRLRRNEIPRLDVFVVIQLQEQDPLRADVRIVETDGGLKVDVRYVPKDAETGENASKPTPSGGAAVNAAAPPAAQDETQAEASPNEEADFIRRVDMVAYVPSGSPLHVRTDDDLIEARETHSDIVAESTGGDLLIITEGAVQAKTSSGSITSVLLSDDPDRVSILETESGEITVQLPDDLNIRARARTSGEIDSQYPPTESPTDGPGPHEMVVRVGSGAHEARLDSQTGDIHIRAWRRSGQVGNGRRTRGALP